MKDNRLKVEIAQRTLSDLGREVRLAYTFSTLTFVHQTLLPAKML